MTAPWSRVFYFDAHVNQESVTRCLRKVGEWLDADSALPVEIAISSGGGNCDAGWRFIEDVRRWRSHGAVINTRASGFAGSMAGLMLQAGARRLIGAESTLHLHPPHNWNAGGELRHIREVLATVEVHYERMLETYSAASGWPVDTVRREVERRRDWHLTAPQAIDWRFADEVV